MFRTLGASAQSSATKRNIAPDRKKSVRTPIASPSGPTMANPSGPIAQNRLFCVANARPYISSGMVDCNTAFSVAKNMAAGGPLTRAATRKSQ
jgi:hypothetical protein